MSATEAGESALRVTRFNHAERVGFIGTGSTGRPMIAKLLQAGYPVDVCDIDPAAAKDLVEKGAGWQDLPRNAARDCEILITCLPMQHDVFDNMTGEQGALAGMPPGSVWIDTSTTDYHNTSEIARRAAAIGAYSLEAPLSNLSHMGVDFANVSFFVGRPSEVYMLSEVLLPTMGAVSFHVGDIRQGQSVKLLTNPLFYPPAVASGDALCQSERGDVPTQQAWRFSTARPIGNPTPSSSAGWIVRPISFTAISRVHERSEPSSRNGVNCSIATEFAEEPTNLRYSQAGRKFDRYDNHLRVVELAQVAFGVRLQEPGYRAPSKRCRPRASARPRIPDRSRRTNQTETRANVSAPRRPAQHIQIRLLECLAGELTHANRLILDEAFDLGRGMGLSNALICDVISWSVEASA
ncbi:MULTISPECIES: NAD(P)-binding domain-containing protein [unclassified Mesorhizobium]|uniref:NAD(P)-dependent oxidoreductase n=1 Tax=unclassified Mesorhizobium TaxID=325217 RepID=UPI0033367A16